MGVAYVYTRANMIAWHASELFTEYVAVSASEFGLKLEESPLTRHPERNISATAGFGIGPTASRINEAIRQNPARMPGEGFAQC